MARRHPKAAEDDQEMGDAQLTVEDVVEGAELKLRLFMIPAVREAYLIARPDVVIRPDVAERVDGQSGSRIAPGLEMDDCGVCVYCLDKPKNGGPGTKRQKCELKQGTPGSRMAPKPLGSRTAPKPMRRDVPHGALPNVEWDASLIGQRARVLVGEHEWAEAIITASVRESHSKHTCTMVLEDGCVSQRVLPDHRVVLHIEAALDSSVGAAVADGDGPGEDAAEASAACTCPLGHRLVLGTAEGDGVSCDGCGAPIDAADGINMYGCSTCDYDLCAACAEGTGGARRTRGRSTSRSRRRTRRS
jgi:hypothetical protein